MPLAPGSEKAWVDVQAEAAEAASQEAKEAAQAEETLLNADDEDDEAEWDSSVDDVS